MHIEPFTTRHRNPMKSSTALILVLITVCLPAPARAESSADLARDFKMEWTSLRYQKSVSVNNRKLADYRNRDDDRNESLTLSCQIHVLKPDRVLGIHDTPSIETLSPPQATSPPAAQRSRSRRHYTPLRYDRRFQRPESPSGIRKAMQSLLGLQPETPQRPELVTVLEPSRVQIPLHVDVLDTDIDEIDSLEGTFHVLIAESIRVVDIPFEPNENWIPLTAQLEVRVDHAQNTNSSYNYRIATQGLGNRGRMRSEISVGSALPDEILIERQLLGTDGKPIHRHGAHSLPASAGGNGSGSGGNSPVTRIRYRIGVHPRHHAIPFKLKRIPLPKP